MWLLWVCKYGQLQVCQPGSALQPLVFPLHKGENLGQPLNLLVARVIPAWVTQVRINSLAEENTQGIPCQAWQLEQGMVGCLC